MNNWKKDLEQAFLIPPPLQKQKFIKQLEPTPMRMTEFVCTQIGYIRKWVWLVFALIFLGAVLGARFFSGEIIWIISAFTPLLALTLLTESGRSECYDMVELEMATRFSLKSVILARLAIVGVSNLFVLCLLIPVCMVNQSFSMFAAGLYITTPFLLTTFAGLVLARSIRGKEVIYADTGIAVGISCSILLLHNLNISIYKPDYFTWWSVGALGLCAGIGKQYFVFFKWAKEPM